MNLNGVWDRGQRIFLKYLNAEAVNLKLILTEFEMEDGEFSSSLEMLLLCQLNSIGEDRTNEAECLAGL